jgi:hypothetical protein
MLSEIQTVRSGLTGQAQQHTRLSKRDSLRDFLEIFIFQKERDMSIGPNELKTAIILCKRASCTGEESLAAAQAILALEAEFKAQAEAAAAPKKGPAPKGGKKKPAGQPK